MEKKSKEKKPASMFGKIFRTVLSVLLVVAITVVMFAANTALRGNDRIVNSILGDVKKTIDNSNAVTEGLDLAYNKSGLSAEEMSSYEERIQRDISAEGIVLLKNDNNILPVAEDTTFSFFSANSAKLSIGGGMLGGGISLKEAVTQAGYKVNDTLWQFYTEGAGKEYGLASGSISFGDAEDFRINECPLPQLQAETSTLGSVEGTVPVYILKRVAGEGRDMPRSMYQHAESDVDKEKNYLEPDSTEHEILKYLNDNYNNTVLVVNSNAALELDWLSEYPNIQSVLYAPDGMLALGDILTGNINPSGRTVDTFAIDALASPAAQNFGDYQYFDKDGNPTKYHYISYAEGIYVGYKYYETRYEDIVLGQGNAGSYDYKKEVKYPFGYGLSYTTFQWDNFKTSWNDKTCTVTVDVTNTGTVAGKDVVEIYIQSPYTDYDKANQIEKASVELAGYGKTKELQPGEKETIIVTLKEEQLKAYDAQGAKTYILDAGTYYITAGKNAHDAVNNILSAKEADPSKMTAAGNPEMTDTYIPKNIETDILTYAKDSYSGAEIVNQFDEARGDINYLSRSDWQGTWPVKDGEPGSQISTWGNEINSVDENGKPASMTYQKIASDDLIAQLDSFESGNPVDASAIETEIVYGEKNGLALIDMRGLAFEDPLWNDLLDQLTEEDYFMMIAQSGYGTPFLESVNKPFCVDADTASGLIYGGTGTMFPNMMTLAQTWNQELAAEYGDVIGKAAIMGGADGWYAPSMNIHRTPFSGRNGEYYSEDAYLSGAIGATVVNKAAANGIYTYIKHLAFNDQENHRGDRDGQFGLATWLNEQSAREIYLKPFEMSMKADDVELNYLTKNSDGSFQNATKPIRACQAVMTAFNRIGATWTGASYPLITGILRNEWAFQGFVLTDNANTGIFMDGYQMIEAGADGKLTYAEESARFDFDSSDQATYHYGREAMHRMLYTVANSKAMNGAMPGSVFVNKMTMVDKIINTVNIVGGFIIILMILLTVRRFWKKKATVSIELE